MKFKNAFICLIFFIFLKDFVDNGQKILRVGDRSTNWIIRSNMYLHVFKQRKILIQFRQLLYIKLTILFYIFKC